jgi:hypothetical protein
MANSTFQLSDLDGSDTIFDYRDGADSLVLDGLSFTDLEIRQGLGQTNIQIEATQETLTTLIGVQASSIDQTDFTTFT